MREASQKASWKTVQTVLRGTHSLEMECTMMADGEKQNDVSLH